MKKISLLLFSLIMFFSLNDKVFATCDNEELNDYAQKVELLKVSDVYKSLEDFEARKNSNVEKEFYYYLVLNEAKKDLYLKVTDNLSEESYLVQYDEEYSNYLIGSYVHFKEKKYTVELYSSKNSPVCPGERLRTFSYSVPAYNEFSKTVYCEENPNAEACEEDAKTEGMTLEEFKKKLAEEEAAAKEKTVWQKVWNAIKTYWFYVLIPIVLIGGFFAVKIYLFKKKEEKE